MLQNILTKIRSLRLRDSISFSLIPKDISNIIYPVMFFKARYERVRLPGYKKRLLF